MSEPQPEPSGVRYIRKIVHIVIEGGEETFSPAPRPNEKPSAGPPPGPADRPAPPAADAEGA